ncbi:hypothetical protein KQI65_16325 [bacterium]|nr:hypothetical protein [bacterium]
MTRCTSFLAGLLLLLLAFALPAQAQTGWSAGFYEGFRANQAGNGSLSLTWTTGNLGNTWDEGEWVPYRLQLINFNINNAGFSDITICYDFTKGNQDARFVDLVRGIQIGADTSGQYHGWPTDTLGTLASLNNLTELNIAQNNKGVTSFGNEYVWSNWHLLNLDTSQVHRATNGGIGGVDDLTRCFTITRQDIINAYGGIGNVPSGTVYIYFNMHLSQTFVWANSLQNQYDAPPTDGWGGYLYNYTGFPGDQRNGSGYVSGSSGHTYLTQGNKTVSIPIPPAPTGELSGLKWHDVDGDQIQDPGEAVLDGWPIYIAFVGPTIIFDTVYTDNSGQWQVTGLPASPYLVLEEIAAAPTTGLSSGYTLAAPAFAQTPPSTWEQTYPDNASTAGTASGVVSPASLVAMGTGPFAWELQIDTITVFGDLDFGNYIPAPICAVFPMDTTICDGSQVTLTAQRIAQGTPPYTYAWTGPNNFTANTQSIVVPASAAGTYTVMLTDANGLTSSGCSGTVNVFPIPDFDIAGDSAVCEQTGGHIYYADFDVNSPLPKDSIVAWNWSITGNGSITSSTTDDSVTVMSTGAGSFTLTLIVTDVFGCTETVSRTITVTAPPVCSIQPPGDVCPGSTGNIYTGPNGAFTYAWSISGNGSINGSTSNQTVSVDVPNAQGQFTLMLTITETTFPFCTSTCSLTVDVRDITPPDILCHADTTIECPAPSPLPFTPPTATDNCDPNPVITILSTVTSPGNCPNEYSVTRTWVAVDNYNNADTCSQTIFVEDNTPPVVTAASDLTVQCDGNGNQAALAAWLASHGGATANDACGGVTWSDNFSGLSNLCGATGAATVTFYATDDCGNVDSTTATFTIEDTVPPTITTAAQDTTVECDGSGNTTDLNNWLNNNGGAVASDICSGVTWSNNFSGLSNLCGATGAATVTFYATDDCGNVDSTSATFTIQDTTPPLVTSASDTTVECDGNGNTTDLNNWLNNHGGATASDDCSDFTWTNNYNALNFVPGCGGSGHVDVTFYATDDCGNVDSTTARFTIVDTTPPDITVAAQDTTVECDGQGNTTDLNNWLANIGGAVASDVCSDFDWTNNYNALNFVQRCGGTGFVDVTFYATDDCGNVDSTSARFTIIDTTPPDITVAAQDTTVECDGSGNTTDLSNWLAHFAGAVASDICSDFSWSHNYDANNFVPGCGGSGYVDVTFYATDVCGNVDSTTARFTIVDTTPPDITVAAQDTTVECDGNGNTTDLNNWLNNHGGAVASDICSGFAWTHSYDPNNFVPGCGGSGYVDVTFYATDDCGNVDSTSARFTIVDTTPPTVTAASDTTVECDGNGNTTDLNNWLNNNGGATATDVCSDFTWSNNYNALNFVPGCGGSGHVDVTFYATDDCGNVDSTTARFTIVDTTPPDITVAAQDTTVECDGQGNTTDLNNWLANIGGAVASDVCSDFAWTNNYDPNRFVPGCGGSGYVDVTFYATDDCGNVDSTSARFTIVDTTPPDITVAAQDTTVECDGSGNTASLNSWLANIGGAVASDVCSNFAWTNNYDPNNFVPGCGGSGYVDVTFYATDDCGNVDSTSARFTIVDTTPPDITTAAQNKTVECDGQGNPADLNAWLASNGGAVASDVCSNFTWSNNFTGLSDDCGETGSATVTFYATDDCGNVDSTSATFTIVDTTPPSISAGVIGTCYDTEALAEAAAIAATTSSDVCSGVTLSANTVGDCNAVITVYATDDCGNVDSVMYNTTIDGTPPVFTYVPNDTTIACTETPVFGTPTATDNCGVPTIMQVGNDVTVPGNCPQNYAVTRTWKAVDGCGNESGLVSQTITVVDDVPPVITPAADDTVFCGGVIDFTDPTYSDNCDNDPELIVVKDTVVWVLGKYIHTRWWKAVDTCGNESVTVSQNIIELCNEFRTLTQGFYGNTGGRYCGSLLLSTQGLIDSLLQAHDTIRVGVLGSGSLSIVAGDAACVIGNLPGGGPSTALGHDYHYGNNCNIIPGNLPLKNGRFRNSLLAQTVTLALNLRLDTLLGTSFFLPPPNTPWMRTEGADYMNGICGDNDDMPDSTFINVYFPPNVLTYLGSNGLNVTPLDLLDLANQALAGATFANISYADIAQACDAINKGFDEARFVVGFYAVPPPKAIRPDLRPSGFSLSQNHPNPFNPTTTITYSLPERSTVYLAVYNSLGKEISVLVDQVASAGTHAVVWDSQSVEGTSTSGLFYYRIVARGESGAVFHDQKKMLLVK